MKNLNWQQLVEIMNVEGGKKDTDHMQELDHVDVLDAKCFALNRNVNMLAGFWADGDTGFLAPMYAECLGALIAVGQHLELPGDFYQSVAPHKDKSGRIFEQFKSLIYVSAKFLDDEGFDDVAAYLFGLGEMLGLEADEVEKAFVKRYGGGAA